MLSDRGEDSHSWIASDGIRSCTYSVARNSTNQEWYRQLYEDYTEMRIRESNGGYPETVDFQILTDDERNLAERWIESGENEKWHQHQVVNLDGISSTDNQYRAQALNNVEQANGFPTINWDHQADGHGLKAAITGLRRDGEPSNQESYVIQTDPEKNK